MKSFAVTTLGCKVNQFDGQVIIEKLTDECGFKMVPFSEKADVYVINTCTVTHSSDAETRKLIRRAKKYNPGAIVVVTGCYAEVNSDEVSRIPGVDLVLGNQEKLHNLPQYLSNDSCKAGTDFSQKQNYTFSHISGFAGHSRAFFKIQDGCNSRCSYCIVPFARGSSRSINPEDVIKQVEIFRDKGFKEIVLTGVHLGSYGSDLKKKLDLFHLIEEIENSYSDVRIRLSSIEPEDIKDEWIEKLSKSKIVCEHLHLPLQSGSDEILKKMNRKYSLQRYKEIVTQYHELIPHGSLGTDIICGFPAESSDDFKETVNFINENPFSYLHVFPFSRRRGTSAYNLGNQISASVIKERCKELREIGRDKKLKFMKGFIGTQLRIIREKFDNSKNLTKTLSRNYLHVNVAGVVEDRSEIFILVEKMEKGELFGKIAG